MLGRYHKIKYGKFEYFTTYYFLYRFVYHFAVTEYSKPLNVKQLYVISLL